TGLSERTYYLNLSLSRQCHRDVIDSLGDEQSGICEEDFPVRQVTFRCEVRDRLIDDLFRDYEITSDTHEIFGRDLEEIIVHIREGRLLRHVHPWQIGRISTETRTDAQDGYYLRKPWINIGVSPAMFQQFWEAAGTRDGERLGV